MSKEVTTPWKPRSGKTEVGGYVWLPRLLDKTRQTMQGQADGYLALEDSYMDRQLLQHWRLKGEQIREWIGQGLDDTAIAARIAATAGEDEQARRLWNDEFGQKFAVVIDLIDATDGRVPPGLKGEAYKVAGHVLNKVYDTYTQTRPWQIAAGVAGIVLGGIVAVLVTSAWRDEG